MSVTQVGVFYATKSKFLQRIHIPDDDSHLDAWLTMHILPNETAGKIPINIFINGGVAAVQKEIGEPTIHGICAVVHKEHKTVIDKIIADPDVYWDQEGHHVILSKEAKHGDSWDGDKFYRDYAHIHPEHGRVVKIDQQPIDNPVPLEGHHLKVAENLKVGDIGMEPFKLKMLKSK